jgi:hypothetical protein
MILLERSRLPIPAVYRLILEPHRTIISKSTMFLTTTLQQFHKSSLMTVCYITGKTNNINTYPASLFALLHLISTFTTSCNNVIKRELGIDNYPPAKYANL